MTIKIPGFVGAAGGETRASEAAAHCQPRSNVSTSRPLPMSLLLANEAFSSRDSAGTSALMVDVDVDRLPSEFFKGPRWVSLNSKWNQRWFLVSIFRRLLLVRFHDMMYLQGQRPCSG